jgi:RNA polymerase sigma-70 factor (ECF subfamily)
MEAFADLVNRDGPRMLAVCRRLLGNDHDAQDAVQDAFLSAFRSIAKFDGRSLLSTWLHRIAVNAALMRLRKNRSEPAAIESLLPQFSEDGHRVDSVDPWSLTPEEMLEREEIRTLVREEIDHLPEMYRTVLILRDIEAMETRQVSELLGVSENVVKVRLHRARIALREAFARRMKGALP